MNYQEVTLSPNGARLQCFIQDASKELPRQNRRPAVLILPGGAYGVCSDREADPVAYAYLHEGFHAFVLRYTVCGHDHHLPSDTVFPKAFEDATAAMTYIHEHAAQYGIEASHIAAVGFSAGGNLASALATMAKVKPSAVILGYPSVDHSINDDLGIACPTMLDQVNEHTCPAFLFATQADSIVPAVNSLAYAEKLAQYKIPYEIHIYAAGDHGLSLAEDWTGQENSDVKHWLPMSVSFLDHIWNDSNLAWGSLPKHNAFSINTSLKILMSREDARNVLKENIPQLMPLIQSHPMAGSMSLATLAPHAQGKLSKDLLDKIDRELQQLDQTEGE